MDVVEPLSGEFNTPKLPIYAENDPSPILKHNDFTD